MDNDLIKENARLREVVSKCSAETLRLANQIADLNAKLEKIAAPASQHDATGAADGNDGLRKLLAMLDTVSEALHYPACWDTVAYPSLADTMTEVYANFKCGECVAPPVAPSEVQGWISVADRLPQVGAHDANVDIMACKAVYYGIKKHLSIPDLRATVQEYRDLQKKIRSAGRPPHADFWHQSIAEAEEKIDAALAAPAAAAADPGEDLRHIAGTMANVLFNLGQHQRRTITDNEAAQFLALSKKWDAALRAVPALPSALRRGAPCRNLA